MNVEGGDLERLRSSMIGSSPLEVMQEYSTNKELDGRASVRLGSMSGNTYSRVFIARWTGGGYTANAGRRMRME